MRALIVAVSVFAAGCAGQNQRPPMDCTDIANEIKRIQIRGAMHEATDYEEQRKIDRLQRRLNYMNCADK